MMYNHSTNTIITYENNKRKGHVNKCKLLLKFKVLSLTSKYKSKMYSDILFYIYLKISLVYYV